MYLSGLYLLFSPISGLATRVLFSIKGTVKLHKQEWWKLLFCWELVTDQALFSHSIAYMQPLLHILGRPTRWLLVLLLRWLWHFSLEWLRSFLNKQLMMLNVSLNYGICQVWKRKKGSGFVSSYIHKYKGNDFILHVILHIVLLDDNSTTIPLPVFTSVTVAVTSVSTLV